MGMMRMGGSWGWWDRSKSLDFSCPGDDLVSSVLDVLDNDNIESSLDQLSVTLRILLSA